MKRLLLGLLLGIGCNGGGGGGDGGVPFGAGVGGAGGAASTAGIANPNASIDEAAVAEYARDLCNYVQRCSLGFYPSDAICIDTYACSARDYGTFTSITRGELLACSRSVANRACDSVSPIGPECLAVTRGFIAVLGIDDSCGGEMCDEASWCNDLDENCPRCEPRAALGESCVGTLCVDGSFCNRTTLECEPERTEGMSCERSGDCQTFSLGSQALLMCRNGVCAKPAALGEACADQADCGVYRRCHNGVCSELVRAGDACTSSMDCYPTTPCIQGVCVEACGLQAVGEPCIYDGLCLDAYCDEVTSHCVALKAAGSACTDSNECASGLFCDTSSATCTARAPDGTACDLNDECISQLCSNGLCTQPTCQE